MGRSHKGTSSPRPWLSGRRDLALSPQLCTKFVINISFPFFLRGGEIIMLVIHLLPIIGRYIAGLFSPCFKTHRHGEHSPAVQYLLGEDEWDEVTHMHGFRRGAPARVEIERLLVFIGIQNLMHVSKGQRGQENSEVF